MTKDSAAVVVATARDKVSAIDQALDQRAEALLAIMPASLDYARFRKVVTLAISKNPRLMECTPSSIVRSVIEAAELGLEPTGLLGRAYLVPYRVNVAKRGAPPKWEDQAELRLGYMAYVDLALRSGRVRAAEARLVYEGDAYEVMFGTEPRINHRPAFLTSDPEKILHAYAVVWYVDGTFDFEPMRKDQIDGIRARSKSANSGPWVTDYGEMAKKTVLRRLMKRAPLTVEAMEAINRDDEREYAAPVAVDTSAARERIMSKLRPTVPAESEPAQEEATGGGTDAPPAPESESKPVAEAPAEEVVEGEVVSEESAPPPKASPRRRTLCGAASPYDDGSTCELIEKHLGLHRSDGGKASWAT